MILGEWRVLKTAILGEGETAVKTASSKWFIEKTRVTGVRKYLTIPV